MGSDGNGNGSNGGNHIGPISAPGLTGRVGPIVTLQGLGGLSGEIGSPPNGSEFSQAPRWTTGLSNGYARDLRKAIGNPVVGALCICGTGIVVAILWGWETEETARQNIQQDPADFFAQWGLGISLCYGGAAGLINVRGHL